MQTCTGKSAKGDQKCSGLCNAIFLVGQVLVAGLHKNTNSSAPAKLQIVKEDLKFTVRLIMYPLKCLKKKQTKKLQTNEQKKKYLSGISMCRNQQGKC